MAAEALILTALKEPVKKLANWIFDEASVKVSEAKMQNALSKLHEKISDVVMVKTFYQINESIDLHKFYVPTRVENISTIVDSIEKIDSSSIVLEGTVGQGKSIFMRYLTYQEANRGVRIPIFFELRRLNEKQTLENAISTLISNWIPLFKKENFDKIASSGDVVLFLDGFDEIPQEDVNRIINEVEGWYERYPNMQIVISTRPESEIQKSIPFKVYKLAKYELYEQKNLVRKLVLDNEFQKNLIKNIENSSTEIKGLLKTPLMVTLFVKQYEVNLKIPKNQSEFYENLFSNIVSLHDNTKAGFIRNINSKIDVIKLQEVFEEFCFLTGNSQKLILSRKEAIEVIKKCISSQDISASPNDILKDFSTVVCLFLKDGSEYSFIHRSIQEYFYSSFISNKSTIAKEKFYNRVIGDKDIYFRLRNALDFLEKIDNYNYNKYFRLSVINSFICGFNITKNGNELTERFYFKVDNDNFYFTLVGKDIVIPYLGMLPEIYHDLFYYIHNRVRDKYGKSSSLNMCNTMESLGGSYKSIYCFDDEDFIELVKNQSSLAGYKLLRSKEKITNLINSKDDIEFNFD
ncbi:MULTISPECIES: NACHT domain-containing protein [unclassified Psychrobacter]|uniref:NACHT domain-containing protein n=1 Tax=unclassified Psychrobacter TaxID=196806 RepID=UPI0018F7635C|nr:MULTISPECIES: NACHT domain-containing protein [unclassified Psychrobacter]